MYSILYTQSFGIPSVICQHVLYVLVSAAVLIGSLLSVEPPLHCIRDTESIQNSCTTKVNSFQFL